MSGVATSFKKCYNTTAWQSATFDHNATQFPLTGAHRAVTCQGCHADGVYRGKSTACVSCHQQAFDASVNPNHRAAAFPTTCTGCHNTTAWRPSTWDHGTTQFPLTGAHRTVTCQQCHGDGVYRGKSTACVSCHQQNYDATTNPNHRSAGFPTTCTTCHNTTAWQGATFDHNATQFPLTGAHRAVTCQGCHADGVYVGKSTACVSCYQQAFDASVHPNPPPAASTTTCNRCHNTTAWRPSTWD